KLRVEQEHVEVRRQADDHRQAREKRCALHQPHGEGQRRLDRQRQRNLPHSELRTSCKMTRRRNVLSLACAWACVLAAASTPSAFAQLKQVAYIKASNTHMGDHFGNGGTLEGHGV